MLNKIKYFLPIILVFLLAFSIRLIAISQKTSMHCDGPYSIAMSSQSKYVAVNYEDISWNKTENIFEKGKTYKAYEVKKTLFRNEASIKSIIKDLMVLRTSNMDTTHANLYYSVLRIWNAGIDGTDYKVIMHRDCALNMIFFCFAFFFMYKLLNLIKPNDPKFCALGLLFAFACSGSVSGTLLIREYAMAQVFMIAATYIFVKLYKKIVDKEDKTGVANLQMGLYSLTFALLLLLGFHTSIYLSILFLILLVSSVVNHKKVILCQILTMAFCSICILLLLYPNYFFLMFHNEHSNAVYLSISSQIRSNIENVLRILQSSLWYFCFVNTLIVFLCIPYLFDFLNIKYSKQTASMLNADVKRILSALFVISFVYSIIVMSATPFKELRFLVPIMPMLSLSILLFIYELKYDMQRYYKKVLVCIFIFFSLLPLFNIKNNDNGYKNTPLNEIIYMHTGDLFIPQKKIGVPIVFENVGWSVINYIMYLDDDVQLRFENDISFMKNYDLDSYILVSRDIPKLGKFNSILFGYFDMNIFYINYDNGDIYKLGGPNIKF